MVTDRPLQFGGTESTDITLGGGCYQSMVSWEESGFKTAHSMQKNLASSLVEGAPDGRMHSRYRCQVTETSCGSR
jgi:hypothetical protein